ncbi:hypothetical protein RSSE_p0527 (plasmid) [Ralstonia solanacearum]|nr:hypothetical protein RSSE_p0527 [Ralstonia solanacearum]
MATPNIRTSNALQPAHSRFATLAQHPPQDPADGDDFKKPAPEYAPQSQQNSPEQTLEKPFPILKFHSIREKYQC